MSILTPHNAINAQVTPPCCDMRSQALGSSRYWLPLSQESLPGGWWLRTVRFPMLICACLTRRGLHTNSSMYLLECLLSWLSTRVRVRFGGGLMLCGACLFCDNSMHNYWRLLRCIWRSCCSELMPCARTPGTGRISTFGAESWRLSCRVSILWWRCFHILLILRHMHFY